MELAYIITTYKDPIHLKRLIDSLNKEADFFIHVDLKVPVAPFKKKFEGYKNVFFTDRRYFINWGGFAQVLSQKELLRTVMLRNVTYERVICLSGLDYPVYSNQQIRDFFRAHSETEFIQGLNVTTTTSTKQQAKIKQYHFFRDIKTLNVFLKKCFSGSARKIMQILPFRKKLTVMLNGKNSDVFVGSDYWAITFQCANYIYKKMILEKELTNYFKTSFVPSEMYIQTIIFNSEYAVNAMPYPKREYEGLVSLTPLHCIEYNSSIKVFTKNDLQKILTSNKMFFRKAITGISDELLNAIDKLRSS